ncbi:MAG: tetratricopeptide repeat protein [Victivallaceae bacterium]|nr:tetratricopeptide repeat protein [Victivallaceae bacterium]
MLEPKTLQDVTAALREVYNRATAAGRKRNWDYAIELMLSVILKEPTLEPARQELRNYEAGKSENIGFFGKIIAGISAAFKVPKIRVLAKKDAFKAMYECEKLLGKYLYNWSALNALADAAGSAGAFFISIEALEIIRGKKPNNESNLRKLADYYKEIKDGMSYLRIFQEIGNMHPNDLQVQAEVRSALAFSTMHENKWERDGSTQEKAYHKEEGEAEKLAEGSMHDANLAQILVQKYTKELEEKESSEARRKLAEAYLMLNEYDKAIEQLTTVQEKLGIMDTAIDKLIEKAYVANIDANIKELSQNPDQYEEPETQIRELREHRYQYRFGRAKNRAEIYPNDTQIRYDLAMLYFEADDFDKALEEFQKAKRNPQRRLSCIIHIGRCLENKGQFDMAVIQFKDALSEMQGAPDEKMEPLYYLGTAYEALGENDKAMECFKEIYQNNINYKDVAQKIQKNYK